MLFKKKKEYNYILFDWDGTIANTLEHWIKIMQHTFKKFGVELTREEIITQVLGDHKSFNRLGITNKKEFMKALIPEAAKLLISTRLNKNARYIIEKLNKNNKKIGLVTSSFTILVYPSMAAFGIADDFDVIVGAEDTKEHKPDAEPIFYALKKLNGDPRQAIMIGDSIKDIQAANAAGIDSCLYYSKLNQKVYTKKFIKKAKSTYTIEDLKELEKIVL